MQEDRFVEIVKSFDEVTRIIIAPLFSGFTMAVVGKVHGNTTVVCYNVSEGDIDKLTKCFDLLLNTIKVREYSLGDGGTAYGNQGGILQ